MKYNNILELDVKLNIWVKYAIGLHFVARAPKTSQGHDVPMISISNDNPTS